MDLHGIGAASVIAILALLSFLFACFKFMIRPLEKGQAELRGDIKELEKGQAELRGDMKKLEKGLAEIKETLKALLSRQPPQAPAGSQGK